MTAVSLHTWLRHTVDADALLSSWRGSSSARLADYELDALTIAALCHKHGTSLAIGCPGGRSRLPLLAAVHAAALQLPGYPSPFTGDRRGPIALVTRKIIRRDELLDLDAAGVAISPALAAARLRTDGLCAGLHGGRPVLQEPSQRLLVVHNLTARPQLPPSTVVIDADDDAAFVTAAWEWAEDQHACPIVFEDSARRRWPPAQLIHTAGWAAINAAPRDTADTVRQLAPRRGYAIAIDAAPQPALASALPLFAEAHRHGTFPPPLAEAATLWRRLDELVVPTEHYDACCPRWHSRTLSERLDDITAARASQFPRGWRTWAQMCWAGIIEALQTARSDLATRNAKAIALADLVDAALRAGGHADVALPSRTARDAVLRHFAAIGVLIPADGRLTVRSLGDVQPWGPPPATVLSAPPPHVLRHRLTGADLGSLNILCYPHELAALKSTLTRNLDEPFAPIGDIRHLLPPALQARVDLPAAPVEVVLTTAITSRAAPQAPARRLIDFADLADAAGLTSLTVPTSNDQVSDLPGDDLDPAAEDPSSDHTTGSSAAGPRAVVPLTVTVVGDTTPRQILVPVQRPVLRIIGDQTERIPVLQAEPSMLVANLEGATAFERLRPLLEDSRGGVTRMLLAAWDQALEIALRQCGGREQLAEALQRRRSRVRADAVAAWSDPDRIGPRDADDVIRVGQIAAHPIVAANGTAIAAVMRQLRVLHRAVGRCLGGTIAGDPNATDQLEELLGADAVSLVNETVIYRVQSIGPAILAGLVPALSEPTDASQPPVTREGAP